MEQSLLEKPLHIIVIEDDDVDAETIDRLFRSPDGIYTITRFPTAEAALGALTGPLKRQLQREPYLVLVDFHAPRMGGLAFLDALRADPVLCRSIVFALTGSDDDEDKIAAYRRRVAGYLIKDRLGPGFGALKDLVSVYSQAVLFPVS
jgi:CheY-like chemotaxis protein